MPFRRVVLAVVVVAALVALMPAHLLSQQSNTSSTESRLCGSDVTPEEARRYLEQLSGQPGTPELSQQAPPYCVPIVGHIVRTSAGTGGMSLSQYQQSIVDANIAFVNTGIVFYSLGVDYIDSDFYYSGITTIQHIDALRSINVYPEAINVYFTPTLPGLCGISSFTFSSVQGIVMNNDCAGVPSDPSTMPHEIGHYFNLYHTHETAFGLEFVDGTNCSSAGDLLCDTPADPNCYGVVNTACLYIGGETDPHGDPYDPDVSQLMSYARNLCQDTFSPMSEAKMVNTLLNLRPGHLSRGCSAVAPPAVSIVNPTDGFVDQTLDIVLVGDNFRPFTRVVFGPGVTVNNADTLSSDDSLVVNVTIDAGAAPGIRDVIVDNAFDPDTLSGGFEVLPTLRHYVSPSGANVYPYGRPSDAATAMSDAVAAAADGDSVLVDSSTVDNVSFILASAVILSGGWTDDFSTRDLNTKKTTLNLNGNILLTASAGVCGLNGFNLQNGSGAPDIVPVSGDYGGAVRIVNTTATVTNCEIQLNDVTQGSGFGGGGGVSAYNSAVTITDNYFHDNTATRGGAVYLYETSGTVSGNTIENNTGYFNGQDVPTGGAIAMESCTGVALNGNDILNNTGAYEGGALWIVGSTGVTFDGGSVSGNSASQNGGGAYLDGSAVSFTGVEFTGNDAFITGGAVAVYDTSSVTVNGCAIDQNEAFLGAAVYAATGELFLRHNLLLSNTAGISGGALNAVDLTGGEVVGNTADSNTGSSGVGGFIFGNSSIDVFNNIVTNSVGHGVSCTGAATPSFRHNLVWNSSGSDYDGCSPGTGSRSDDPQFANPAAEDYHLALASPAIDTGDPDPGYNDPDGSRGDIGRFGSHSFTMAQPSYPKNLLSEISGGDLVLTWSRNQEPTVSYYAVFCDSLSGFGPSTDNLVTTSADTTVTLAAPADTAWYVVCAVDTNGYASGYSSEVMSLPTTGTAAGDVVRYENRLEQNVPNPFNPTTTIRYSVADRARVSLRIYDVSGRLVRVLADDEKSPGVYTVVWNGVNDSGQIVSSGVYFYRFEAGSYAHTRKLVLLK